MARTIKRQTRRDFHQGPGRPASAPCRGFPPRAAPEVRANRAQLVDAGYTRGPGARADVTVPSFLGRRASPGRTRELAPFNATTWTRAAAARRKATMATGAYDDEPEGQRLAYVLLPGQDVAVEEAPDLDGR